MFRNVVDRFTWQGSLLNTQYQDPNADSTTDTETLKVPRYPLSGFLMYIYFRPVFTMTGFSNTFCRLFTFTVMSPVNVTFREVRIPSKQGFYIF